MREDGLKGEMPAKSKLYRDFPGGAFLSPREKEEEKPGEESRLRESPLPSADHASKKITPTENANRMRGRPLQRATPEREVNVLAKTLTLALLSLQHLVVAGSQDESAKKELQLLRQNLINQLLESETRGPEIVALADKMFELFERKMADERRAGSYQPFAPHSSV